jgi:hypothetical protein
MTGGGLRALEDDEMMAAGGEGLGEDEARVRGVVDARTAVEPSTVTSK